MAKQDRNEERMDAQAREREGGEEGAARDAGPDADPDAVLETIDVTDEVRDVIERLERERDEAVSAKQRALADYANFQRRSIENERRAGRDAANRVLRSLVPALDHFQLALNQDPAKTTPEQMIGAVRMIRDEIFKAMQAHGVERIAPEAGDEFDPNRHEAMMREPSEDVKPGRIVRVLQIGYATPEQVLRPAQVSVAQGDTD